MHGEARSQTLVSFLRSHILDRQRLEGFLFKVLLGSILELSYSCVVNIYATAWIPSVYLKHQDPSNDLNMYLPQCPRQLAFL